MCTFVGSRYFTPSIFEIRKKFLIVLKSDLKKFRICVMLYQWLISNSNGTLLFFELRNPGHWTIWLLSRHENRNLVLLCQKSKNKRQINTDNRHKNTDSFMQDVLDSMSKSWCCRTLCVEISFDPVGNLKLIE